MSEIVNSWLLILDEMEQTETPVSGLQLLLPVPGSASPFNIHNCHRTFSLRLLSSENFYQFQKKFHLRRGMSDTAGINLISIEIDKSNKLNRKVSSLSQQTNFNW